VPREMALQPAKKDIRSRIPHTLALLLGIVILVGILTYVIPAGEYTRIESGGRTMVDPNSFHYVEQNPVTPFEWFRAVPEGIVRASNIIAVIFLAIGGMGVYTETGAFQSSIAQLLKKGGEKTSIGLMLAIMIFISVRSGFEGALESQLSFTPLTLSFALAAGYDVVTGVTMAMLPAIVSHAIAPTNPYIGLVAQEISGLPPFSGIGLRIVGWVLISALTYYHIISYALKVKKDRSLSLTYDLDIGDIEQEFGILSDEPLTGRQKVLMIMLLGTVVCIVLGAVKWKVGLLGIAAIFLISGILAGLVAGYDNRKIASIFVRRGSSMYFGALCVGVGRAIQIVLENGKIIDTIIHGLSGPLQGVSGVFSALAMYVIQLLINFFIPSGSGQAVATMPIMAPLADLVGVTRQTAVLAFQMGDGITNMIFPTVGHIWAFLAFGRIPYERYIKYVMPLFWKVAAVGAGLLIYAQLIQYGPF